MCAIASALMDGNAAKWLDRLTTLSQVPSDFQSFETAFLNQFHIIDDENIARDKLKEAKQKGSVQQYVAYFDTLVLSLPKSTTADLIHSFIYGLKAPIK